MSKFIITLICILLSVSVTAETVYKKTNPDGSVEFTDLNSKDSEEIKIRKPTTYKPPSLPAFGLPVKKLKPSFNYSIAISKPAEDATVINQIDVVVAVSIQPPLSSSLGHQIRYSLGGETIVSQKTSETFKNVPRGTHSVIVSIIDIKGEVISPIVSSNFHMKRFFKKPPPKLPKPKVP